MDVGVVRLLERQYATFLRPHDAQGAGVRLMWICLALRRRLITPCRRYGASYKHGNQPENAPASFACPRGCR